MNLGLCETPSRELAKEDKNDQHHIELYSKMLEMVPGIREEAVNLAALEMGCGRGGGCYVMKRYFQIKDITAIDLSSENIKLAETLVPGVAFFPADAVEFKTRKRFDLILNLESSHRYSSRAHFFRNVAEHLKNDGNFLFGDMLRKSEQTEIEKTLRENGFRIMNVLTVNDGIIKSVEQNSKKQYPVATRFPFLFPKRIHSFFVTTHSRAYSRLQSGEVLYNLYLLKKN